MKQRYFLDDQWMGIWNYAFSRLSIAMKRSFLKYNTTKAAISILNFICWTNLFNEEWSVIGQQLPIIIKKRELQKPGDTSLMNSTALLLKVKGH